MKQPILKTIGLTCRFGGLVAVNDLTISIEAGQTVGLIGPNGAGKTTVFNLLSGFTRASSGEAWFRGQNIIGMPPFDIARLGMARTFQVTSLLGMLSVGKNVQLAVQGTLQKSSSPLGFIENWDEVEARADQALMATGLTSLADRLVRQLSHGDQRRVEIAMALAAQPHVILLDEPTQGMSATETWATVDLIKELCASSPDLTVIIVEHDIPVVLELAERIIVLHLGGLIADGSPAQISENEDVQEAYLGLAHVGD